MFSRSFEYNPNSYQSLNYGSNQGYNGDSISYTNLLPQSFSSPQTYSSYHNQQDKNLNNYQSPFKQQPPQKILTRNIQNKSFLDNFDNNTSGLLNQQKSYARNIKGRLLNNEDPSLQKAKQDKQASYKQQLQRQIQQTRQRKQAEKDKIQKEQLQRERKFYDQFKIKAQVKDNKDGKKQQNGYFMIRTLQKFKRSKNEPVQDSHEDLAKATAVKNEPPIPRGKTYQNKSSLDNWGEANSNKKKQKILPQENSQQYDSPQQFDKIFSRIQQQIVKQRSNEEQRLAKLLLFQQRVLQKITDIKSQIRNTANGLDTDKQLQRVRNNLRAKPIPFDQDFFKSNVKKNIDINHYYSLPKRQLRPATKYSVKLKDSNITKQQSAVNKKQQVSLVFNDKNKLTKADQQAGQQAGEFMQ